MLYRKLPTVFLFTLSFLLITASGYQCSTRVNNSRGEIAVPGNAGFFKQEGQKDSYNKDSYNDDDDYYYSEDYFRPGENTEDRLPEIISDNCRRGEIRDQYDSTVNFEFDKTSLKDFLFGNSVETTCSRLKLEMSKVSYNNTSVYRGSLKLILQFSNGTTHSPFESGFDSDENRYNKWSGASWSANNESKVNKRFQAIFENNDSAIILKIEDVRIRDKSDGEVRYIGAGTIYYKMFRYDTNIKGNIKGLCYSQATYIRDLENSGDFVRNDKCWFNAYGPFTCRPQGLKTDINLSDSSYKCFSRLGRFWGLDIEEAFNDPVEDID